MTIPSEEIRKILDDTKPSILLGDGRLYVTGAKIPLAFKADTLRSILVELLALRKASEAPPSEAKMADALLNVISAWESTKPGQTTVQEIKRWLIDDMKPAIDAARNVLK